VKHFKHLIFDLDGTLTDPGAGITRSIQYALAKYGKTEKTELLYKFIGPPLRETFRNYFGFSIEQLKRQYPYIENTSLSGVYLKMKYMLESLNSLLIFMLTIEKYTLPQPSLLFTQRGYFIILN
jgi:phosphoglycolate phosphatase